METPNTNIFYNDQQLLSYKRLYNMIMGVRGHGKTYNCTRRCIATGLEKKKVSFVVLVRYKEDIKTIKDSWWSVVEHLFPQYHFSSESNVIYAQNELEKIAIGEYVALSEYTRAKKVPRPYVKYIFFDEFLNEDNDYLPNEIDKFLSVCDSIIRNRDDVRVMMVTNTISMINPYFDYFGINKLNGRFTKGNHESIVEFTDSEEFTKYRQQTKFGSSIKNTKYGEFAIDGRFMLDDTTNVIKDPKGNYNYLYNLMLEGLNISVYLVNNLMYLCYSKDYTRTSYTPYVEDAKKYGAIFCEKTFRHFKVISKYFMQDKMMFEHLKIKNAIIELLKFMMGNRYK